jgi:hypothetical protein
MQLIGMNNSHVKTQNDKNRIRKIPNRRTSCVYFTQEQQRLLNRTNTVGDRNPSPTLTTLNSASLIITTQCCSSSLNQETCEQNFLK